MKTKQKYFTLFRFFFVPLSTVSILWISGLVFLASCRKWVEVSVPDSRLSTGNVFSNDLSAEAAVAGIYSSFWDRGYYLSVDGGLSADELRDYSQTSGLSQLYSNQILADNPEVFSAWQSLYNAVYQCNSVLSGLGSSSGISPAIKSRLTGEALTWRAFYLDYLSSFWGSVPLILTPDYKLNATATRTSVDSILPRLLADLREAAPSLPEDYEDGERTHIIKWANLAVQARINARAANWTSVDSLTSAIIGQTIYELPADLDSVFLKNSPEAIWQSEPQGSSQSTVEGSQFILFSSPTIVALEDSFISRFEPGDGRKTHWVGSFSNFGTDYFFPFKYKDNQYVDPLNEYGMVIRLAEMFLLRAEASGHLGMIAAGYADLNRLRERAGLPPLSGTTLPELMTAITNERRVELFSEWADRWLFLKRTGQASTVIPLIKSMWQDYDTLYPIPKTELQSDNYLTQNPGY